MNDNSVRHNCLQNALLDAGIEVAGIPIPEPTPIEELPAICAKLGIKFIGDGKHLLSLNNQYIAIYQTREGWAHCQFVPSGDLRPYIGILCGVICVREVD